MTDPRRFSVVAAAQGEVGPGDLTKYWASCGITPAPDPHSKSGQWCGIFALWALHEAGLAENVMWVVGLGFIYPQRLPTTKSPQPGDILYVNAPYQHHGIVESLEDGILTTIEGNQPDVKCKVRPLPKSGITFYSISKFLVLCED